MRDSTPTLETPAIGSRVSKTGIDKYHGLVWPRADNVSDSLTGQTLLPHNWVAEDAPLGKEGRDTWGGSHLLSSAVGRLVRLVSILLFDSRLECHPRRVRF